MSTLRHDILAQIEGTPTTGKALRVLILSLGFGVVLRYRLSAYVAHRLRLPFLGKLIWSVSALLNGCFLSPRATIGPGLSLPHPIAIVIGDDVEIGQGVTIYQNVTIGRRDAHTSGQYPRIGDNVVIYAGACLVGAIRIGNNSVIGANAVVTCDVPDGAVAVGVPARIMKPQR